jgi:hypothetical protein
MREKEREKRHDELFDEIKPRTLLRQQWKRKEESQSSTTEPAAGDQTATLDGQTAQEHEAAGPTEDQAGLIVAMNI